MDKILIYKLIKLKRELEDGDRLTPPASRELEDGDRLTPPAA